MDAMAYDVAARHRIMRAMSDLNDRQVRVLKRHYVEGATLAEIGADEGITGVRVRQIEVRAIRKMRATERKSTAMN